MAQEREVVRRTRSSGRRTASRLAARPTVAKTEYPRRAATGKRSVPMAGTAVADAAPRTRRGATGMARSGCYRTRPGQACWARIRLGAAMPVIAAERRLLVEIGRA